jgi:signal peptidase complex subunit 3
MHTVWVRLNAVVFFGLTVLLGLSCLAALSKVTHSYYHRPGKQSTMSRNLRIWTYAEPHKQTHTSTLFSSSVVEVLKLNKLKSLKSHGGVDRALLSFDIKVDLTPAFHWNIKQLFVYVVGIYETEGRKNTVVLWDKIVQASDKTKMIDESNVFVKYALVDQGDELRGKEVTLQLQWDHMPITGLLYMDQQPIDETTNFQLPATYQ